jgi:hypothetical protein
MHSSPTSIISLAPGFSSVLDAFGPYSRFNGLLAIRKAAEAAAIAAGHRSTGLKSGANGRESGFAYFANTPKKY